MECNKDEAVKAKDIAEKKMQSKEFEGARRLLLKAQQLYPEIDNFSQLLSVCDVHCSAKNKFGNEMDWYGILQVEQTSDDTLIKKQYRKFALLLHPDKNQFAGAEAAFKLIGEAQRVLLDKEKRASHDMKRRTSYKHAIPYQQAQPASRNVGVVRQSRPHNNFASNTNSRFRDSNLPNQGQTQQGQAANGKETFWTRCIHCSSRYQFYREILAKVIRCPGCEKPFVTQELHDSKSGVTQPVILKPEAKNVKPTFDAGFQAGQKAEYRKSQKGPSKVERKGDAKSNLRKANSKRGKKHVESSESFESDSSVDSEEVEFQGAADSARLQHFDCDGDSHTRRSSRNRQHVSYNENVSDDEQFAIPSKKAKGNASSEEKPNMSNISDSSTEEKINASNISGSPYGEEDRKKECNMDDRNETLTKSTMKSSEAHDPLDSSLEQTPESTPEPTLYDVPDPEFCDFDQSRDKYCFRVGELWAAYDTVDAMPRFYAKIKKVYALGFKLQITWLEPDPYDDVGKEWTNSKLPFSCGKFKVGETEITKDHGMFSHVVCGWKSMGRSSFMIYPRVREIWAIFKNWDAKWCSVPEIERKFEYEFVEVLSDYDKSFGIRVAPLSKVKGFASLFCRNCVNEIQIQPYEVLRFSHMVPSYRTTGNEKKAVPKGYIELDPASTTMNLEEIIPPQLDRKNGVDDLCSDFAGPVSSELK